MLGLSNADRNVNVEILQNLLANEYVLLVKTRNFHWNIRGDRFMMFHLMLDGFYNELNSQADGIAERIRELDGIPEASMSQWIKRATISEVSNPKSLDQEDMIDALINDENTVVEQIRAAIPTTNANKDFGTMDLLTKWMELHEHHLYFLRSHKG